MKGSSVEILATVSNDKHFLLILNEHLLEEGCNMRPKHAAGYDVHNTVNLHTCFSNKSTNQMQKCLKFIT